MQKDYKEISKKIERTIGEINYLYATEKKAIKVRFCKEHNITIAQINNIKNNILFKGIERLYKDKLSEIIDVFCNKYNVNKAFILTVGAYKI